jgi:Family of unknown function (DUF6756)
MANRSYATANSILAAARECNLDEDSFHQLPGWRAQGLLDRVLESFTTRGLRSRSNPWLWEDLRDPTISLAGQHEIRTLLALGAPETPVWLIVEDFGRTKQSTPFWVFEATLAAAIATLENHHLLEFYLVSRSLDWLVGENHRAVLFAAGDHAVAVLRDIGRS